MSVRRLMLPFFIVILVYNCSLLSYGANQEITTRIRIGVNIDGAYGSPDSSYRITKKVKVGSEVYILLEAQNKLSHDVWLEVHCTFIQGEDIAGRYNRDFVGTYLAANGGWGNFGIEFHELPSTGIIALNFSYEGYYEENDVVKTFTSEGAVHEIYIEVVESLFNWNDVIFSAAFIGVIVVVATYVIIRRRKKSGNFGSNTNINRPQSSNNQIKLVRAREGGMREIAYT